MIVARHRPDVYELMAERFADEPGVRVMFDRRSDLAPPADAERRLDEDPSRADLWDEGGYLVVVLPD